MTRSGIKLPRRTAGAGALILALGLSIRALGDVQTADAAIGGAPNHLLALIDDSGSMRKSTLDWSSELRSFLRSIARQMGSRDNPSGQIVYDPNQDYLSVFLFGLDKKSELSFTRDFLEIRECFAQSRPLDRALASIASEDGRFARNWTAHTLALNLGLHQSRDCAPTGTRIADTWLLLITDGESNISAGDPSELVGLEKHFRNTGESSFPPNQGFDYVNAVIADLSKIYDLQKEVYREYSSDRNYVYCLVRVRYKIFEEAVQCVNPTPDIEFSRRGDFYRGSLPIRIRPDCAPFLVPLSATVHLTLGAYAQDVTRAFPSGPAPALKLDQEVPVTAVAPGAGGEAKIDVLFQVADQSYGLGLTSQSQTANLETKAAPILFEPLGIEVPDRLYRMFPELDQEDLHRRALVMLWAAVMVGLLLIGYPLYYLLSWPRYDLRIEAKDQRPSASAKVLEARVGVDRDSAKELVAVFACEESSSNRKRFGFIPVRKEPFPVVCKLELAKETDRCLKDCVHAFGFSWDLQNPYRIEECYPGGELNLFFDPSRLKNYYPSEPGEYELRLKLGFKRGAQSLDPRIVTRRLRFVPEPARPRIDFHADPGTVEFEDGSGPLVRFRQPSDRPRFAWLDVSNQVVHACCEPLNVEEIAIELWREGEALVKTEVFQIDAIQLQRSAQSEDGAGEVEWRDVTDSDLATQRPEAKVSGADGRYRLKVSGLGKDWRARVPLSLDFSDRERWEARPGGDGHRYLVKATIRGDERFGDLVESFAFVLKPGEQETILGIGLGEDESNLDIHWFRDDQHDPPAIQYQKSHPIVWSGQEDARDTTRIAYLHFTNSARDGDGQASVRLKLPDQGGKAAYKITMTPDNAPWTHPHRSTDLFALFIRGHGSFNPAPLTALSLEHDLANRASEYPLYQLHFRRSILKKLEGPDARICLVIPLQYRIDGRGWKDLDLEFSFTVQKDLGNEVLGIDMGTSAIVAVKATDEESALDSKESVLDLQKRFVESCHAKKIDADNPEAETRFLPSVIYVDLDQEENSDDFIHLPAERLNLINHPGEVVPFLKSYIGLGCETIPLKQIHIEQGRVTIQPRDVILQTIVTAAYQKLWGQDYFENLFAPAKVPLRVVITYPNTFSIIQLLRLERWLKEGHFKDNRFSFISESNAVAFYYLGNFARLAADPGALAPRQRLLVYDLGAGTLDISVLEVLRDPQTGRIAQMDMIHKMGLPLGGNIVDVLCARIIDRQLEALARRLDDQGIKAEFVNKIVPDQDIAHDDGLMYDYRICMEPIRKMIQEQIKPGLKGPDASPGTFHLEVPLDLDRRPLMSFKLKTPVGDADENQRHLDQRLLDLEGIRPQTRDAGKNYLIPLDGRLFGAHFEPGGLFGQYLKMVVDTALANVAANIKRGAGAGATPDLAVDTVIISGRASLFADLRERVVSKLTQLNQDHPLTVVELREQELKHCVAQGALLYEYLFREVTIIDRSIYGKFGFWSDAGGPGSKRFVELLGPDSFLKTAGSPQHVQNTKIHRPAAAKEIDFPSECNLFFGMTYENDPEAVLNALQTDRDRDYFWTSRLVRLKKVAHRVAKGKAKIKMAVEWDDLAGISYLAAEVNDNTIQLISTESGTSTTPLPRVAVGGYDLESIWPMEPLQAIARWPNLKTS